MKKFFVISLSILIFGFCVAYGYDIYKNKPLVHKNGTIEYDFSKQSQYKASRILYKYVQKDLNKTPKELKDFANITPKSVRAFETDLNGDNQNEVIGVVYTTFYLCTQGFKLFILEKQGQTYQDLSDADILTTEKFFINNINFNKYKELNFKSYNNYYRQQGKFVEMPVYLYFENSKYRYNFSKMKKFK